MSDTENTPTDVTEVPTNAEAPAAEEGQESNGSQTTVKLDKGNLFLTLESITEGQWKGFSFFVPEFKSLSGAISHFTEMSQNGKDGEDIILGIVNSALANRMRSRANSKLVVPNKIDGKPLTVASKAAFLESRKQWLLDPVKRILVTEQDALEYVPGEREVDSLSGLIRQKDAILKVIKEKKDAIGRSQDATVIENLKNEARVQLEKYKELMAQIEAKQRAEQDELLNSI